MSTQPTIVVITKDLFFVPGIRAVAEESGIAVVVGKSHDDNRLRSEHEEVVACVVDLSAIGIDDFQSAFEMLSAQFPAAKTVAFGPHVHQVRLDRAREVGFEVVLSKGQFASGLGNLIPDWLSTQDQ